MTEINDKAQLDIATADDIDAVTSDTPEETVNTPEVDETFELSAAKMREHGMSETAMPHDGRTRSKTHCPFDKISATFMEKQHLLHPVDHAENPARVLPCIP